MRHRLCRIAETPHAARAQNGRMLRSSLDRAFARYARTGEPEALARVFDGCANELYRIGFHLLGDRHAAEDLVQQTFVVAIEHAKGFDRSRRVLPWLCGILTNRALLARRQQRTHAAAAARGPIRDDVVDPMAQSAANEVTERIAATVRALPEPYRQVLLLHLVHELAPQEIAEALARPDATVRTQLARGLERLRKLLPVGVGGFAVAQLPPPIGLATVRAAVLAHAAEAWPTTAVGASTAALVFSGVVAMKKAIVVFAVLAMAVSTWLWWCSDPALPPALHADEKTEMAAAPQHSPLASSVVSPSTDEEKRSPASGPVDPHTAELEVRVLWHDGTPAADVPVRVRPRPLTFEAWLRVARTGDDGVARFVGLPPVAANALTGRGANADVELAAGSRRSTTITLGKGIDVHGRVVDLDDRAIAGATVWMSVTARSDDSEPVAVSGSDGAFVVREAGKGFTITASAPGLGCARVLWVGDAETTLTLRPAPGVVAGRVVDENGRPVAGARVLLGVTLAQGSEHWRVLGTRNDQDLWPSRFLRTDDDGRFWCEGLPALRWPLWVGAPGFAAAWREVEVVADAPSEVTVVLARGGTVRGRIMDASGAPLVGIEVKRFPDLPAPHQQIGMGIKMLGGPPLWAQGATRTDADGRYAMQHVMVGNHTLAAWAATGEVTTTQCTIVGGATFVWDHVVATDLDPSHRPLEGVLVDEHGAPLKHWQMRVGDPKDANNHAAPHHVFWVDEDGTFRTNPLPPGRYPVFVTPTAPMSGREVALGEFDVGSSPTRLVVPRANVPAARVRGRLVLPAAAGTARGQVHLLPMADPSGLHVVCDEQGRFTAGPVQDGRYRLRASSRAFGEFDLRTVDVVGGRDLDLGELELPMPGTLTVHLVDPTGSRVPDAFVVVEPVGDTTRGGSLEHRDGIAEGQLPAGRWRVASRGVTTMAAIEVDVRAGIRTVTTLRIPAGVPFVLRVPESARERPDWRLHWRDASSALLRSGFVPHQETGTDHPMRAAAGRYTLELVDAQGVQASTTFDLRADDPAQVVELPLPQK